jgi:diguanylate cyclase (GGDEF)-like protein/PAS domain S-box-containing protein
MTRQRRKVAEKSGADRPPPGTPRGSGNLLESLARLFASGYWEMDEDFRFTRFDGHAAGGPVYSDIVGKRPWEIEGQEIEGGWEACRAQLTAHQPFSEAVCYRTLPDSTRRYFAISGEPVFDTAKRFKGYHGVGRDITARKRAEHLLSLEHTVTRCLADADTVNEALTAAIRAICETENWEYGQFWRLDEKADVLRFDGFWVTPGTDAAIRNFFEKSREVVFHRGVGLMGRVWESDAPIWVADVSVDPRVLRKDIVRETGLRSTFRFPVTWKGKTIGVFDFASRQIREPDARLLQATRVIGSQIGQFLQRQHAEEVMRESEMRFRSLTEMSLDWYWVQDAQHRFTEIAGSVLKTTGLKTEAFFGKPLWDPFFGIELSEEEWTNYKSKLDVREPVRELTYRQVLRDGGTAYYSVSCRPFKDDRGNFAGYRGVGRDITEQKRAEAQIHYLATHDGLTGLPNRLMFSQLLNLAIATAQRYERKFAVLFIDLDRFKLINDTLGHEAGNALLKDFSKRLKENLRSSDIVARLGGDEFAVLVPEVGEPSQVATVARQILSTAIKPMLISGQDCRVTASVGISIYPEDAQDEESLLNNADLAMYLAKEEGKNNFRFFSNGIRARSLERIALETNLRQALEREEFFLHYQPKLDLKTQAITGVEALLRWQNKELGLVPPALFIPVAEEIGLIVPIGKWVMRTACTQAMAWQRHGLPPVRIAVNLSPRQFTDQYLLEDLASVLLETGLSPNLLELELTEGTLMSNVDRAMKILAAIHKMGVRLALDDFGTGYSSLAQLKRFPFDTLKVDRSFVRDLMQNPDDQAITDAIIAMGKTLSMTVIAEGVETQEQEMFLREHACDESQGFYFSKPITADKFAELLRQHRATERGSPGSCENISSAAISAK